MGIASRFSAIGQLKFPAVQIPSADVTTLDDYIEGTWTPIYYGSSGSIGATAYSTQSGRYTKIGRLVFINGTVTLTNNGDWTGNVRIAGLPFAPALIVTGSAKLSSITFDGYVSSQIPAGVTYVEFSVSKTGTAAAYVTCANTPDNGTFSFILFYSV
jgi:hypothetical protein